MAEARRESPLAELLAEQSGVSGSAELQLVERRFAGMLNLRGSAAETGFSSAVSAALGGSLPTEPNITVRLERARAFWLAPDEWLLTTVPSQQTTLLRELQTQLASTFAAVTDISTAQTILHLIGAGAADLLSAGSTLDLHPRVFPAGCCAQTTLARATMVIRRLDDGGGFELVVRRSFADYAARWILDAGCGRVRLSTSEATR